MRNVPNDIVQGLIRHLPRIIKLHSDTASLDNRTKNAIRLTKKILRRLEAIENDASNKDKQNADIENVRKKEITSAEVHPV